MTERAEHKKKKIYNVQPLKTKKEINDMRACLKLSDRVTGKNKTGIRNVMLFEFGINTGLRVSDIVKLKVNQVSGKDRLIIREKKTGKVRTVFIKNIKSELAKYISNMNLQGDEWLFPSRKHGHHVSTTQVYRALVKAGKHMDPPRNDIGTHTMRKTFGWWYIKRGGKISVLMKIFNHSSEAITKRYLGIQQEDIEKSLKNFHI